MAEMKYPDNADSDSDCDEEAIVTGHDSRVKITQSIDKNEHILKCIGRLTIQYRYINYDYQTTKGTATVFDVVNGKAFALTAAHNTKTEIIECSKCKIYMAKKTAKYGTMAKTKKCIKCNVDTFLKTKLIDATNITFSRDEIEVQTVMTNEDGDKVVYKYGDPRKTYPCKVEYVDAQYSKFPQAKSGDDYAIISFMISDNYDYKKYSQNIKFADKYIYDRLIKKEIKDFRIYGYPKGKKGMFGMKSAGTDYTVGAFTKGCGSKYRIFLTHKEVDTGGGQSGAALWCSGDHHKYGRIIFGIHTGGSQKHKYNAATIITPRITVQIENILHPKPTYKPFTNDQLCEWVKTRGLSTGWEAETIKAIKTHGCTGKDFDKAQNIDDFKRLLGIKNIFLCNKLSKFNKERLIQKRKIVAMSETNDGYSFHNHTFMGTKASGAESWEAHVASYVSSGGFFDLQIFGLSRYWSISAKASADTKVRRVAELFKKESGISTDINRIQVYNNKGQKLMSHDKTLGYYGIKDELHRIRICFCGE
eukprot:303777_1